MLSSSLVSSFKEIPTPFYYYDMDLLSVTLDAMVESASRYGIHTHYAIKANCEEKILREVSRRGVGADCVSGNEVLWAVKCGFHPEKIIFSGVGKSDREIIQAMDSHIGAFNCESTEEMEVISEIAATRRQDVDITVRINPDIDAHTHRYITTGLEENKFGLSARLFDKAIYVIKHNPYLHFKGLHFHVGSQIMDVKGVFSLLVERAVGIIKYFEDRGLEVVNIDYGGGLGIDYETPSINPIPDFESFFSTMATLPHRENQILHAEPGRSVVAQCGALISRVLYVKAGLQRTFLILDAGMTDLIRPALYGAYHSIENLSAYGRGYSTAAEDYDLQTYDVVGPICESSDVWGQGRQLPLSRRGDIVAILSAGAYGSVMASRYNMRDLPGAVFSDELR